MGSWGRLLVRRSRREGPPDAGLRLSVGKGDSNGLTVAVHRSLSYVAAFSVKSSAKY